ncbi:MAG: DUF2298 domain-containing protein, partial [Chlorobiales bacterium]|nr:DUF2298 domain-containing protein [Chlorobiales bacterium]
MADALRWYLILSLLGWLSFPLAYRLLKKLPDRGYSLARPLGLLLWGFIFWLLGSYGLLGNDAGGLIVALLLLLALSYWALRDLQTGEIIRWLREKARLVLTVEVLFLLAFVGMALLRANNPAANSTEKPMELAFVNAILQSPTMPPHDPWLSGYSISYYYFGYLMTAMLATASGVLGGVAFNLSLAMIFAMGALGAYGLAFNLLSLLRANKPGNLWAALLAPIFVLLLGNVQGLLEVLHANHSFWTVDAAGNWSSAFWSWLDLRVLADPPLNEAALQPQGHWWWWRASRVIRDVNFLGVQQEVIDEFPAFSFVLGDLHPHVLSIPFVFLTMALGLNLFMGGGLRKTELP